MKSSIYYLFKHVYIFVSSVHIHVHEFVFVCVFFLVSEEWKIESNIWFENADYDI